MALPDPQEYLKLRRQRLSERSMPEKALGALTGAGEVALQLGTGAATDAVSGLKNTTEAVLGIDTLDEAVSDLRAAQNRFTYQPKSPEGQKYAQAIGEFFQPYEELKQGMGEWNLERYGSPGFATASHMLPDTALALATLGLGNAFTRGSRLKTRGPQGEWLPTPLLENALRDKGMSFLDLDPNTVNALPEIMNQGLLPGTRVGKEAQKALEMEAAINARHDVLAPFQQKPSGRLGQDPEARATLKQGVEPNIVQMIKTSSGPTRFNMARMLSNAESIIKNKSGFNEKRPLNIVGDSVGQRLIDLRKVANEDRVKLEQIRTNDLPGLGVNTAGIGTAFNESMQQYGIGLARAEDGALRFDYSGSELFKDRQGQRMVEEVADILDQYDMNNLTAAQAHLMKKQIDSLLNYEKIDMGGVSDIGERIAKQVRLATNDSIRAVSPDYAAVNDRLTSVLDVFNEMQRTAGKRINLFDPETNARQLGQEMRKLLTNYKTGPELEKAIKNLQSVAGQFGLELGDNLSDMVEFANFLENRFKVAPSGSFRGVMQDTVGSQVIDAASNETLWGAAKDLGRAAWEKGRGINDDEAIKSLYELIRKGQQ